MSLIQKHEVTEKHLAGHRRNGRQCLRVLRGYQSLNTETAERSVPSVLKALRHRERGEGGPSRRSSGGDSSLRQVRWLTNVLVKVRNGAQKKDVKNEGRPGDVLENTDAGRKTDKN